MSHSSKKTIHLSRKKLHDFIDGKGITIGQREETPHKNRYPIQVRLPAKKLNRKRIQIIDVENGSGIKEWFNNNFSKAKRTAKKAGETFRKYVPKDAVNKVVSTAATTMAAPILGPVAPLAGAAAGTVATKVLGYGIIGAFRNHGFTDGRKFAGEVPHSSKIPIMRGGGLKSYGYRGIGRGLKPYGSNL